MHDGIHGAVSRGDVNGDGTPDVLVASPRAHDGSEIVSDELD